jgi:hypothetical protein
VQGIRNLQLRRRLIATYDDADYYAGVNLSIINLKDDSPVSLLYLLGIINSRTANYWFSNTFVDHRVKNAQLEALPVPVRGSEFATLKPKLESEVSDLMSFLRRVTEVSDGTVQVWQARADASRERIEQIVEQLYGLGGNAIREIREAPCNASTRRLAV